MKEHPIIFSTDMVKAILDGRKTQTRRVRGLGYINREPDLWLFTGSDKRASHFDLREHNPKYPHNLQNLKSPYGQVGDRLWVRETHAADYAIGGADKQGEPINVIYKASHDEARDGKLYDLRWTPSIHMFKRYSRITLEITEVRVERVQEITARDCEKEGIDGRNMLDPYIKNDFKVLWNSLNDKRGYGWDTNCWVWVVSFKRIEV